MIVQWLIVVVLLPPVALIVIGWRVGHYISQFLQAVHMYLTTKQGSRVRSAILQHFQDGMTHQEIASAASLSYNQVRRQLPNLIADGHLYSQTRLDGSTHYYRRIASS